MIPEGWKLLTLRDVVEFTNGKAHEKDIHSNGEFIVVNSKFISSDGKVIKRSNNSPCLAYKHDILMVMSDVPNGKAIAKCFYVNKSGEYTVNQRVAKLTAKTMLPKLLFYLLNRNSYYLAFDDGIKQTNLRKGEVLDCPLYYPPLPEQKKIAQILSTWDAAIETVEKLIANSQKKKKALMQQLLTGKKRFPGFDGEWEKQTLEELEDQGVITLSRGSVISKKDIAQIPGQYPIYSSSVKNSGLFGCYGKYMFDEELITWSVDGGGNFFYRSKHRFSVTNVSGYMRLDTDTIDYRFLADQLDYLHGRLKFDYQTKAHPSVIRKLYTVRLPSLEEQQKITSVLSSSDSEIETWQQELAYLKQEKKALMQQLLTGKKRVLL